MDDRTEEFAKRFTEFGVKQALGCWVVVLCTISFCVFLGLLFFGDQEWQLKVVQGLVTLVFGIPLTTILKHHYPSS